MGCSLHQQRWREKKKIQKQKKKKKRIMDASRPHARGVAEAVGGFAAENEHPRRAQGRRGVARDGEARKAPEEPFLNWALPLHRSRLEIFFFFFFFFFSFRSE
jgi:hypothetical protein